MLNGHTKDANDAHRQFGGAYVRERIETAIPYEPLAK